MAKKKTNWNKLNRTIHYWGSSICAIPVIIIIISGMLLTYKKDIEWIQPPSTKGVEKNNPAISFPQILDAAISVKKAEIYSWQDIDRLDVRPQKGITKIQAKSGWEIQIDNKTTEVLQVAYRRSDLIEAIHDGSFFSDIAKYWIFFPSSLILLTLWITGMYLFLIVIFGKKKKKKNA